MANTSSFSSGISGRYATALFELCKDSNALDALEQDLTGLKEALAVSPDLKDLIASPLYTREDQGAAITAIADKMGLSGLPRTTLGLMAANRRLFVLPHFIAALKEQIANHKGEITAEVTAAKDLTAAQSDALAASLKAAYGKDIVIKTDVDPGLIGGMVVKVGSKMIDTSIRAKLQNLQNAMKEVG